MKGQKLTQDSAAATSIDQSGRGHRMDRALRMAGIAGLSAMGLSGCINVAAPEEPIVIELNVNIEARLLVELAEDANNTIDENADIF